MPILDAKRADKLTVIALAEAMRRIHNGESVSVLSAWLSRGRPDRRKFSGAGHLNTR